MWKGSGDNPSKVGPIVLENTSKGLVLQFRRLHLPRSFVGLKSIQGPQLSSGPLCYTSKILILIVLQVSSLQRSQVSHFPLKVASVACCSQVSHVSKKACCHDAYVVPITT
jgi:hypothetical protein